MTPPRPDGRPPLAEQLAEAERARVASRLLVRRSKRLLQAMATHQREYLDALLRSMSRP